MSLYELLQSKRTSSSGTGSTYYGTAAACGMKARLQEIFPYEEPESDGTDLTPTGKRKVNARRAGSFYHMLQEMWRLDQIPADVAIAADQSDYDFEIALNSFTKYRQHFGDNRHNLGRVVGAEQTLPATHEQRMQVQLFTGGIPFTMRYDLLTEITYDDVARIAVERELALPGPGLYLVDYKLVASISAATMWQYSYEFQQLAYPVVYNVCHPDRPVRGMLTEVMARVLRPEPRHFALYLAYADERTDEIVRHGIECGNNGQVQGRANPFACIGKYGPCFFLTNGVCPRRGTFHEFDFSSGKAERRDYV